MPRLGQADDDRQRAGGARAAGRGGRARASGPRARPTSVPTTAMPTSATASRSASRAKPARVRRRGPGAGRTNAGTSDELEQRRGSRAAPATLATSSAVRSTGARRKPSRPPSSRSATKRRLMPSIAANRSVTHSTPAARSPSTVAALQREVEDDERHDRERRHGGDDLRRAQLEAQVLATRAPTARRISGTAPRSRRCRPRAPRRRSSGRPPRSPSARSASARPPAGSCEVTTRVRPLAAPDERLDERGGGRVEVGARLVEQEQLGVVQDRAGHRQPLDHPARERVDGVVGAAAQADGVQELADARGGDVVQARVEAQVLARAEVAVEQRVVPEQPDAPAHRPALARERRGRGRAPSRRAGAAAWPGRAAASTCPPRWARRRRASPRPAGPGSRRRARAGRRSGGRALELNGRRRAHPRDPATRRRGPAPASGRRRSARGPAGCPGSSR